MSCIVKLQDFTFNRNFPDKSLLSINLSNHLILVKNIDEEQPSHSIKHQFSSSLTRNQTLFQFFSFQVLFVEIFPGPLVFVQVTYEITVPTKLLGTPPFFQCILMALRVLEKMQYLLNRLGQIFFLFSLSRSNDDLHFFYT